MKTIRQNTRLQAILQATTLFGFALYFTGAVISGAAYRYVHERHIPMLLFSAVVFFLIGMLKLKKVMQESHRRTSLFNNGYTGVLGYSGKTIKRRRKVSPVYSFKKYTSTDKYTLAAADLPFLLFLQ